MIVIRLGIPTEGLIFCCAAIVVQAQPELPQWRVSPAPALTIGGDGAPSTEFSRIAAAVRLTKGEIVVADGAAQQLRLFDGQGRFCGASDAGVLGRGSSGHCTGWGALATLCLSMTLGSDELRT